MFTLSRMTARFAAVASFAALLTAACNTDSTGPSSLNLSAHKDRGEHNDNSSHGGSSGFVVLANAAVTCTGGSIIGDVGTFKTAPPGAITLTEGCVIDGARDVGGPAAVAAYNDFLDQYAALAPKAGDNCPVIAGTLAGITFAPGVYCVSAEAKTGVLTLNGGSNSTWLIKVPAGALTGTNFHVVLAGGAQACNVTWWVDAASTMTTSDFQGNLLTGAAITMTGGTFNGNAFAGADGVGDVTFTGTAVVGCENRGHGKGHDKDKEKCNQGVGNGPEGCDPGNSNHRHDSNDEDGGKPGDPGRKGGH
jgi:ice-binding like protein